ncbi:sortase domain-bontaining protein [Nocardioides speluncae]|uniref:sortase domain-containing protein n=1 Tax=Nocardioides speluncae TaxID=2670337 RepID=UPI00137A95C5|nr:sortase [Nocardioides speluncae]
MINRRRSGGRRGFTVPAATAALIALFVLAVGGSAILAASPNRPNTADVSSPTASATPTSTPSGTVPALAKSEPRLLVVPKLGVRDQLVSLDAVGSNMQLPPARKAGWFTGSVTPGEPGVSVIAGYISNPDHTAKHGVFWGLHRLKVGDKISVRRQDGTTAEFSVTEIASYPAGKFPTERVYATSAEPLLRLVTTGGKLHPKDAPGNVVVYADLVASR